MRKRSVWSNEEDTYLVENYNKFSNKVVASYLNRTIDSIKHRARKLGLRGRPLKVSMRKYSYNSSCFSESTLVACYWAGFLAADGHLAIAHNGYSSRLVVGLAAKDKEHLDKLRIFLGMIEYKLIELITNGFPGVRLELYGADNILNDLVNKYRVTENKTQLEFPNHLEPEQLLAYTAGFIDGDGSLIWDENGLKYIQLANQATPYLEYMVEFIDPTKRRKLTKTGNTNVIGIGRPCCVNLYDSIVKLPIPLLDRKWRAQKE